MKRALAVSIFVQCLFSLTLFAGVRDDFLVSFTPDYPAPVGGLPHSDTFLVSFTPNYAAPQALPYRDSMLVSFTPDYQPPSIITDLVASPANTDSITLSWTAPGNNGSTENIINGQYNIKYSTHVYEIEPGKFAVASTEMSWQVSTSPGNPEQRTVTGLEEGAKYYFQIRTADPVGNWSEWSDVAEAVTYSIVSSTDDALSVSYQNATLGGDTTDVYILVESTSASRAVVALSTAAASGLGLVSELYDIGPDGTSFAPPARMVFRYAEPLPEGTNEDELNVYRWDSPETGWEVITEGLVRNTDENWLSVDVTSLCLFGIFAPGAAVDRLPPRTVLSFSAPVFNDGDAVFIASHAACILTSADDFSTEGDNAGTGVQSINYILDGIAGNYTNGILIGIEGGHLLEYHATDKCGNEEPRRQAVIRVDGTPPNSELELADGGQSLADGTTTYLNGRTALVLSAADPLSNGVASGLKALQYAIDSEAFLTVASSSTRIDLSTLPEGRHIIRYRAVDNVGNIEQTRSYEAYFDGSKPRVVETWPADDARVRAKLASPIKIIFSEPVSCADWYGSVIITEAKERIIKGLAITYDPAVNTLIIDGKLKNNTVYSVTVKNMFSDRVGNRGDEYTFSFETFLQLKEGGTVYDRRCPELTLVIPPDCLPCDGYFDIRLLEGLALPPLARPLRWILGDGKAYEIVFRDVDGKVVQEAAKKPFKMVCSGKSASGRFAVSKEGTERLDLKLCQVEAVSSPDTALQKAISAGGSPSIMYVPSPLAAQIQDPAGDVIEAETSSFGLFSVVGFAAPGVSLEDLSCYPSPFDPMRQNLTIQYYLVQNAEVAIAVYDLLGNLVKTWKNSSGEPGAMAGLNQRSWDGRNGQGDVVANGGYIVLVHADGQHKKFKVLVVK